MQFDVTILNPPYEPYEPNRKTNGGSSKKLWPLFLYKSMELLKTNGYLAIVMPNTWCGGKKNQNGGVNIFKSIVKANNAIDIRTHGVEKDFPKPPSISISTLLLQKTNTSAKKVTVNGRAVDINNLNMLPTDNIALDLMVKFNDLEKFNFVFVNDSKNNTLSKDVNDAHPYKIYLGPGKSAGIQYCSIPSQLHNSRKIIIHRMSNQKLFVDDLGEISPRYSSVYLLADNELADNILSLFETKLYKFLIKSTKFNQYNELSTYLLLPKVDLSKSWTDQELYKHFNLTEDEVAYIEKKKV